jgi:hypothetical protein
MTHAHLMPYMFFQPTWVCPNEPDKSLLKPINNTSVLIPYEQAYIQSLHQKGKLISEQSLGELNPLLQLSINPYHHHHPIRQYQSSSDHHTIHMDHTAASWIAAQQHKNRGIYMLIFIAWAPIRPIYTPQSTPDETWPTTLSHHQPHTPWEQDTRTPNTSQYFILYIAEYHML